MFSSESEDDLMQKVLPVDDNEDDVDFSIPPTSGQEYLRRVIYEAKNCPNTVVANVSCSILSQKQDKPLHVPMCTRLHPAPQGFAPNINWQKQQVADFAVVRQKLAQYKEGMKNGVKPKSVLPLKENVNAWCALCFGRLGVVHFTQSSDEEISSAGVTRFLSSEGGTPPLLSIVSRLDQRGDSPTCCKSKNHLGVPILVAGFQTLQRETPTVVKVLEYHVNWFEKTGFSIEQLSMQKLALEMPTHPANAIDASRRCPQGRWFYALLACLEKPLDPDACFLIRTLARHCASLRATVENVTDSRLVALNLLICLVSRFFDQLDLGDDAS